MTPLIMVSWIVHSLLLELTDSAFQIMKFEQSEILNAEKSSEDSSALGLRAQNLKIRFVVSLPAQPRGSPRAERSRYHQRGP